MTTIGGSSAWDGASEELFFARRRWAEVANTALASAHVDARIDHRSLEAQGITRERKLWIPRVAYEIERRGGHSFVAERIRENYRARLEPQRARPEPQRAAPESRTMERICNRALSQEAAALQIDRELAAVRTRASKADAGRIGREVQAVSA